MSYPNLGGTVVPAALLPHIGAVSVRFSHLNAKLDRCIWKLLKTDQDRGQLITQSILNFSTRLEIFHKLGQMEFRVHQRLKDLVANLQVANDDRNRLTHDEYYYGNFLTGAFGIAKKNPVSNHAKMWHWDADVLNDLIERLWKLYEFLYWIENDDERWKNEPLPSLDKSPTQLLTLAHQSQNSPDKPPNQPPTSRQLRKQRQRARR